MEVTGIAKKNHEEEPPSSDSGIMESVRGRWVGHVAYMGAVRNPYKTSVRKLEGKRPHEGSKHMWNKYFFILMPVSIVTAFLEECNFKVRI
jgi:hypothetical protein